MAVVEFPKPPGERLWMCHCGSYSFFLKESGGVQCVSCGHHHVDHGGWAARLPENQLPTPDPEHMPRSVVYFDEPGVNIRRLARTLQEVPKDFPLVVALHEQGELTVISPPSLTPERAEAIGERLAQVWAVLRAKIR